MSKKQPQSKPPTTPRLDARTRVIPRNIYETIHFIALEQGGIGAGGERDRLKPRCVYEMVEFRSGDKAEENSVSSLLAGAGITRETNDEAVQKVNKAKGVYYYDWWWSRYNTTRGGNERITFEEWCAALNVVPDDSDAGYGELWSGDASLASRHDAARPWID